MVCRLKAGKHMNYIRVLLSYLTKEENAKSWQNTRWVVHVWAQLGLDDETKRSYKAQKWVTASSQTVGWWLLRVWVVYSKLSTVQDRGILLFLPYSSNTISYLVFIVVQYQLLSKRGKAYYTASSKLNSRTEVPPHKIFIKQLSFVLTHEAAMQNPPQFLTCLSDFWEFRKKFRIPEKI